MRIHPLTGAMLAALCPTSTVLAAALDRSSQSISGFLQPNNYIDFSYSTLDADLSGKVRSQASGDGVDHDPNGWNMPTADRGNIGGDLAGTHLSDIAKTFGMASATLKLQLNDQFSVGVMYDQPFGAKSGYSSSDPKHKRINALGTIPLGADKYAEAANYGAFHSIYGETAVEVNTHNLSLIFGYHPIDRVTVYGGLAYQTIEGEVQLRGSAYGPLGGYLCNTQTNSVTLCTTFKEKGTGQRGVLGINDSRKDYKGYEAELPQEAAFGIIAGAAYQIPEIALRASITYRSKIEYDMNIQEKMPEVISDGLPLLHPGWHIGDKIDALGTGYTYSKGTSKISTPQSLNIDLQSGIMADTLAYINFRWVDWSDFSVRPHQVGILSESITTGQEKGPEGFNLIAYKEDQKSVTFGVARKLDDKLALTLIGGWDSGVGEYATTLGPSRGFWSAGLGGQYSFNKDTFVQAGARYFWLGDAKSQSASWYGTSRHDGDFEGNTALGLSVKIGHRF